MAQKFDATEVKSDDDYEKRCVKRVMRAVCLPFQYSVGGRRAARLPTARDVYRKDVMFLSIKGWGTIPRECALAFAG